MYPDTYNPVASIAALKKYGTSRSAASYIADNYFEIPTQSLKLFDVRYLLSWQSEYFLDIMQDGTITRKGITYRVIYYRTTPAEIKKHKGHLLLSFRALQREYDVMPVVLVTRDFSK